MPRAARAGGWWRMAKQSDEQTIDNLEFEFEALRSKIDELRTDANDGTITRALAWLGKPGADDDNYATMWGKRRQFCARFTYQLFTWGQDASQRNESMTSGARAEGREEEEGEEGRQRSRALHGSYARCGHSN
jgi:hypothetical protein